jgi:hypothetical protein
MSKLTLKMPGSFGEAVTQVFAGGSRVPAPDLKDLSDRGLADIGLIRRRVDFEAARPFWLA